MKDGNAETPVSCAASALREHFSGKRIWVLISFFLLLVIVRFLIALLVQNPPIPTDELRYKNMAYSFFRTGSFYNTRVLGFFVDLPTVLYPFILSVSFYFGDHFYEGMKLINSLLINAAIFPIYLVAKDFMSEDRALLVSAVIMLMPTLNYVGFIAQDGPNFPLFWLSFLFAFRSVTSEKLKYPILLGFSLSLLLLNKHSGVAFLVALMLAYCMVMLFPFRREGSPSTGRLFLSWMVTVAALLFFFASLSFALKGTVSYNMGLYGKVAAEVGISRATLHEFLPMVTGLLSTSLAVYFVFIAIAGLVVFSGVEDGDQARSFRNAVFLLLGFLLFGVYLAMTVKVMSTVYNVEKFARLHARYYYMVYPFFIIAFAAFSERIVWSRKKNIALALSFAAVTVANVIYFLPRYVTQGLTIFDNPDLSWYVTPASMLNIVIPLTVIAISVYCFSGRRRSPVPYLVAFVAVLAAINFAEIKNIAYYDALNSKSANFDRNFVRGIIDDPHASVVLVDSWIGDRLWTAFWLPYDYTAVYDLPKGALLKKELIPPATQYVVLFDEYKVDFPATELAKKDKCVILLSR